jgi:hypothetical protein
MSARNSRSADIAAHVLASLHRDNSKDDAKMLIGHDEKNGPLRVACRGLTAADLRQLCIAAQGGY